MRRRRAWLLREEVKDDTNWPYLYAILRRFFNIDANTLTYSQFLRYLEQVPRIRKWEAGENPDEKKGLDTEAFVAAVMAGDVKPQLRHDAPVSKLTDEQKKAEEARVKKLLQLEVQREQVDGRIVVPPTYGSAPALPHALQRR